MQFVEHDVVALFPIHGVDDDVLPVARRVEERHFVLVGAEELGEPRAGSLFRLSATAPVSQEHLLVRVGRDCIASRSRHRPCAAAIGVSLLGGEWKIRANVQRIFVRGRGKPTGGVKRSEAGGGRGLEKAAAIHCTHGVSPFAIGIVYSDLMLFALLVAAAFDIVQLHEGAHRGDSEAHRQTRAVRD